MPRVTLQTIADRLGVSRMTVSNAFSRPDQLSEELRQRVLEVAQELGYAGPDPTARALARGSAGAVGVLLTDSLSYAFTDDVATRFLGAIVEELAPTGLALTLLTSDERSGDTIRDIALDGAIVYSCRPRSTAREWLLRRKLPIVDVDQDPDPEVPSVNVDDRGGARAAAAHLVDLGHERIAILTVAGPEPDAAPGDAANSQQHHPQLERFAGWNEVLSASGIEPAVRVVAEYSADHAAEAVRDLLTGADRPTAVLCYSDLLALGVLKAARDSGLHVPGDLSVVGFDDSPAAHQSEPALTTVRQDVAHKGRLAAAALIEAIGRAGERSGPQIRHEVLPTELVKRASTAPPPAG
jgi:DNA-binding LacI/PurR family transcriptional regulator